MANENQLKYDNYKEQFKRLDNKDGALLLVVVKEGLE